MTIERIHHRVSGLRIPRGDRRLFFLAAITIAAVQFFTTPARAQGAGYDDENAEVLTRGPVHEAFATVVDYNPGRGLVTRTRPPDPIDELPPEERPEGSNVAWIPGYWAWDDEQTDYIWVSGTWRVPPPGREWVPGYWAESEGEYIWIAGFWGEIEVQQTTYLPPPPESLESGPNIDRPSLDYGWAPGCWIWRDTRYVWRPGYWARGRGDWVWVPSYYVWTPHGYIFIDGYWDYVVARRGIVYAPVRFRSRTYWRSGYRYSPRIVFNVGLFSDHLFLRPRWCHYYFGDYYAPRYESAGFFFTFSYHSSWRGYDPFYSYWCWENRRDRDWESRYQASYRYRREHDEARPPSTWSAQVAVYSSTTTTTTTNRILVAGTTAQLSSSRDFNTRFRRVDEAERRNWGERGRQVRTSREERRTLELRTDRATTGGTGAVAAPVRLERPRSSIASKPTRELPRDLVPPRAPNVPKPDPKVQPASRAQNERPSDRPERRVAQPQDDRASNARVRGTERAQERERAARTQSEQRAREERAREQGNNDQQATERRGKESDAQARRDAQARENREAQERESAAKAQSQQRAREQAAEAQRKKDQQAAERRAKESDAQARRDAQARENREAQERESAAKAQSQQRAREQAAEAQRKKDQQAAERRAKEAEARAIREAQAREKREAAQRAKEAEARKREEAKRQADEKRASKSKPSSKEQRSKPSEEEDQPKEEKKNGRP